MYICPVTRAEGSPYPRPFHPFPRRLKVKRTQKKAAQPPSSKSGARSRPGAMFFGVTKLGTQHSFKDNLKSSSLLTCFSDAEYTSAYDKIAYRTGGVTVAAVPDVLAIVYRGPAPGTDAGRVAKQLEGLEPDAPLTLEGFLAIIEAAKADEAEWDAKQLYQRCASKASR